MQAAIKLYPLPQHIHVSGNTCMYRTLQQTNSMKTMNGELGMQITG